MEKPLLTGRSRWYDPDVTDLPLGFLDVHPKPYDFLFLVLQKGSELYRFGADDSLNPIWLLTVCHLISGEICPLSKHARSYRNCIMITDNKGCLSYSIIHDHTILISFWHEHQKRCLRVTRKKDKKGLKKHILESDIKKRKGLTNNYLCPPCHPGPLILWSSSPSRSLT